MKNCHTADEGKETESQTIMRYPGKKTERTLGGGKREEEGRRGGGESQQDYTRMWETI
jgi:hypothetical protein